MTLLGFHRRWSNSLRQWFDTPVRSDLTDPSAIPTTAAVTAGIAANAGGSSQLVTYTSNEPTISSGAVTLDLSLSHHFYIGMTEDITTINVINKPTATTSYVEWTVRFGHLGTDRTVTFPNDGTFAFPSGTRTFTVTSNYLEFSGKTNSVRTSGVAVAVS